ncbi:MAG: NADH-quinone oxidoreductase subunit NuoD [Nitrospira bacterium HGW-Nitrospira-1]|nr:MAG: NADH-quinone oxidoreductase subunit NuoD [Nitrospira bacterium HGW-Nitrospira-1]
MTEFLSDEMVLNMGPHHPSTHGVLRFILQTDGEMMRRAIPDVGFLHRGIEKIAELLPYQAFMPYTDRIDYLASICCNFGYALTVERLAQIEVPEKAEYLRVISAELTRIGSHFVGLGALLLDLGAVTPFVHALREREVYNDLMESLCGARLTHNYVRIGGVSYDEPPGFREKTRRFIDHIEYEFLDEFNELASFNTIFINRMKNVGVITAEDAIEHSLVGPNLRGSGVKHDIRKNDPYSIYNRFNFDIPVGHGKFGTMGDCYDRYWVRVEEVMESCRIIRQALELMPETGPVRTKLPRVFKPPKGEIYVRTECPRGEMGFYLISDGGKNPYRLKIRTGSFSAAAMIGEVSQGVMVADLVTIIGSFDVVAPEIDR